MDSSRLLYKPILATASIHMDHHNHHRHNNKNDYVGMLLEEAEKLYNKLAKEIGDETISDYASKHIIIIITLAITI